MIGQFEGDEKQSQSPEKSDSDINTAKGSGFAHLQDYRSFPAEFKGKGEI